MSIIAAMDTTLELALEDERPKDAKWFGGGGCVFEAGGLKHVFVRGTLMGSFGKKDQAARKLMLVVLAQGERVHLERLAEAFDVAPSGLRLLRRIFEKQGGGAVMRRTQGGKKAPKVTPRVQKKLEAAFAAGVSVSDAWETIGKKHGLGRSTVGEWRLAWSDRKASELTPTLAVVPPEPTPLAVESEPVVSGSMSDGAVAALTVVPDAPQADEALEKLKSVELATTPHVQHLGTWVLVAMVARLGLYETARGAAGRR